MNRIASILFTAFFYSLYVNNLAYAQSGQLDRTYGNGGVVRTHHHDLMVKQGSKLLIARSIERDGFKRESVVLERRFLNWQKDSSFKTKFLTLGDTSRRGEEFASNLLVLKNDKILLTQRHQNFQIGHGDEARTNAIVRLLENGDFDLSFGQKGIVRLDFTVRSSWHRQNIDAISEDQEGRLVLTYRVCQSQGHGDWGQCGLLLIRLKSNGSLDKSFGQNGKVLIQDYGQTSIYSGKAQILLLPNSKIWVLMAHEEAQSEIYQYNRKGERDFEFGDKGIVHFSADPSCKLNGLKLTQKQKILFWGICQKSFLLLGRLLENGQPDASFGHNGLFEELIDYGKNDLRQFKFSPEVQVADSYDGGLWVAGIKGIKAQSSGLPHFLALNLFRVLPNGKKDLSFGEKGQAIPLRLYSGHSSSELQSARIIWLGSVENGDSVQVAVDNEDKQFKMGWLLRLLSPRN